MLKKILLFLGGAFLGLVAGLFFGFFQFERPENVVREPREPGEARLEYEPPAPPRIPIQTLTGKLPILWSMLRPRVHRVTDDVFLATGFALGNVGLVKTGAGLVVIDTTESPGAAAEVLAAFREITSEPVHTIIYTHFHPDHTQGTSALFSPGVRVIATRDLVDYIHYQNDMLGEHHLRARATQAGAASPKHAFGLPVEHNPFRAVSERHQVIMPTVTFEHELDFTLGGKRFLLFHTSGETPDHLAVWLPDERVLFTGDLFYASFPNLSSPMLESRPVRGWIRSLGRFIALESEYLLPGHTGPVTGAARVRQTLTSYRAAIEHVHDRAVRCIEQGKTADQAVVEIGLPDELAGLPYLAQVYGRVSWSVRGIYRGYTGWYDGRGTGLNPLPAAYRAREMCALAGGAGEILARAIALQEKGEHQLAAELCEVVIAANPKDELAHRVKAASMHALAFSEENLNNFGFYRSAYSLAMKASGAAE